MSGSASKVTPGFIPHTTTKKEPPPPGFVVAYVHLSEEVVVGGRAPILSRVTSSCMIKKLNKFDIGSRDLTFM